MVGTLFVHEGMRSVIAEDFGLQATGFEIFLHLIHVRGRGVIMVLEKWHCKGTRSFEALNKAAGGIP